MARIWFTISACVASLAMGACRTVSTDDQFYTLTSRSVATQTEVGPETARYSVFVGPAAIPEMVDRPQFVVQRGENRVAVIEQHRWAEPLRTAIPQAVAAALRSQLPQARVSAAPGSAGRDATYRILLDIERFDSNPSTGVTVHALWTIRRGTADVLVTRHSRVHEPVSGEGYEQLAGAHGRALSTIGMQMAEALRTVETQRR